MMPVDLNHRAHQAPLLDGDLRDPAGIGGAGDFGAFRQRRGILNMGDEHDLVDHEAPAAACARQQRGAGTRGLPAAVAAGGAHVIGRFFDPDRLGGCHARTAPDGHPRRVSKRTAGERMAAPLGRAVGPCCERPVLGCDRNAVRPHGTERIKLAQRACGQTGRKTGRPPRPAPRRRSSGRRWSGRAT